MCRKFNFNLRCLLDLSSTSLEQNLRLKYLGYCPSPLLVFYMLFGCPMLKLWLLQRKQSHSLYVNHCVWTINFWIKIDWESHKNVEESPRSVKCLVGFEMWTFQFDWNVLTNLATLPKLEKIHSPVLHHTTKSGNTPIPKTGLAWPWGGL